MTPSPPPAHHQVLAWTGHRVDDVHGRAVGQVAGLVVDRVDGAPLYLLTRLRGRERYVVLPLDGLVAGGGRVLVPLPAETIRGLPGVPADGALSSRTELLAREPFPALPPRPLSRWERRRTTALARAGADGAVTWDPGPRPLGVVVTPRPATSVLIADDSAVFLALVRRTLRPEEGFEVVGELRDGGEVAEHVLALQPDLVVLDVVLPGRNGLDLAAELAPDVPSRFLLVSGYDELEPLVDSRLGSRVRFVPKAAGPRALLAAARAAVARPEINA